RAGGRAADDVGQQHTAAIAGSAERRGSAAGAAGLRRAYRDRTAIRAVTADALRHERAVDGGAIAAGSNIGIAAVAAPGVRGDIDRIRAGDVRVDGGSTADRTVDAETSAAI